MKTRIIVIAVAALFALTVAAGAAPGGKGNSGNSGGAGMRNGGEDIQGMVVKELGLSKDQAEKIFAIVKQFRTDVAAIREGDGAKEEKAAKVRPLREKARGEIMAVLTPEQQAKARRNIIQRLLAPRQGGRGLVEALAQLNLSDEQKAATKPILKEAAEKGKAIRENTSLTPEQRRDQNQSLGKATIEKIMAILNPEQQTKLKQILAQRMGNGEGRRGGGGNRGGGSGGGGGARNRAGADD